MRWLIAVVLSVVVVGPVDAGVFKSRGSNNKPAATPKKAPATAKKTTPAAPKKAPAEAPVTAKATPKKTEPSTIASRGRPGNLVDPKKTGAVVLNEDDEEDVIIRDIDD